MYYSDTEARKLIIEAGHKLVEEKLIARTWGNISAKISESRFIITPSGLSYESLKPQDLVVIDISDCSWTGDIKPSSEKGIHAVAYSLRKDVNFIIHTHQLYASAVSVAGEDTQFAPCAGYGLPGTKKLRKEVEDSIRNNMDKNCFLMMRHGALCLGESFENAFENAYKLEQSSKDLFETKVAAIKEKADNRSYLDDYAQIMGVFGKASTDEEKQTLDLITEKNNAAARYNSYRKSMNIFDVMLQHFVYKKKYSKMRGDK